MPRGPALRILDKIGNKAEKENEEKDKMRWCSGRGCFSLCVVLVVILGVWGVFKPTNPRFVLLEATVFNLSVSETNLVTSSFEVTVRHSNPSDFMGIYYESLGLYASIQDQQITLPTAIAPTYQERKGVSIWSELVSGESVPVATFTEMALKEDQTTWNLPIIFNLDGFVKWRTMAYTTRAYPIQVTCHTNIPIGNPTDGVVVDSIVVKYQLDKRCTVND